MTIWLLSIIYISHIPFEIFAVSPLVQFEAISDASHQSDQDIVYIFIYN